MLSTKHPPNLSHKSSLLRTMLSLRRLSRITLLLSSTSRFLSSTE